MGVRRLDQQWHLSCPDVGSQAERGQAELVGTQLVPFPGYADVEACTGRRTIGTGDEQVHQINDAGAQPSALGHGIDGQRFGGQGHDTPCPLAMTLHVRRRCFQRQVGLIARDLGGQAQLKTVDPVRAGAPQQCGQQRPLRSIEVGAQCNLDTGQRLWVKGARDDLCLYGLTNEIVGRQCT